MTLSQNIPDTTNPRNGECGLWVGTVISHFPIISEIVEIVVASAMFVTQVIVLED